MSTSSMSQAFHGREEVFRPVDAPRWSAGKRQPTGRGIWGWVLVVALLLLTMLVGALLLLGDVPLRRVVPDVGLMLLYACAAIIFGWASESRELVVTSTHLCLRYRWAWASRLLGWSVPLAQVQEAGWMLGGPGRATAQDPLILMALDLTKQPQSLKHWWIGHRRLLAPAQWAPVRDGRAEPGPWIAPAVQPTAMQVFLMRAPPLDAAATRDLESRLEQLPLVRALRARGVALAKLGQGDGLPTRLSLAGQINLTQVPSLRRGLFALLGLFGLSVAALVLNARWSFFATPWALYLGAALACAALCAWLLWPRGLASQLGVTAAQARQQAGMASVFMGALCGGMLAWLLGNGLLWATAHSQPLRTVTFALDKSRIDPGPILLRPVDAADLPAIEIDTGVSFWRKQPEGAHFQLAAARVPLGGWWMYDNAPITEAMRKQ